MRAEAEEEATTRLDAAAGVARAAAGVEPERMIRLGEPATEILDVIRDDEDIAFLVLAAGSGGDGPGPLVSAIAGHGAAAFPVPVVIVPGGLSDEEIDALAG
jgi:nucleotide-binding universal stress UspA family protein